MKKYIQKEWLNDPESPSTGSISVFDGEVQWGSDGALERTMWVEVADCHCKVRLHKAYDDTIEDFHSKIKKMRDVLDDFIEHFEST